VSFSHAFPSGPWQRGLVLWCGLVLLMAAGCEAEYPADLHYGLRTDPLVIAQPAVTPTALDRPGQLTVLLVNTAGEKSSNNFLDPADLKAGQRDQLEDFLEQLFGTPASPKFSPQGVKGLQDDARDAVAAAREALRLDDQTLTRGSGLYRLYCLHCHGLTGNGRGPTAPWVNPHPRDYRPGMFKFTSSSQPDKERKARREDLTRTLREGIDGTSMPSFGLLADQDIDALVSYVMHLSIRGQTEFNVMKDLLSPDTRDSDLLERANGNLEAICKWWRDAEAGLIRPDPAVPLPTGDKRAESIARGAALFRGTGEAGCISCHKDYGRNSLLFYDGWGNIGRPTDLTTGVLRGGRRPIDLFWRIHSGLSGSNMPAFSNLLKTQDIWDMVNFVQILPYPKMRQQYGVEID
jgi:mono/diheme cytochrome c family protein